MKVKAIIFDLDGTLADTIDAIRGAINATMRQYGYPEKTYEDIRRVLGNGAKNLVRGCMPVEAAADAAQHERVFLTYQDNYDANHLATDRCYDGIPEAIAALHTRGIRLAVLSNKQDRHVCGLVAQLFPNGEFEIAMGQTELPRKPDPTVPLMIAEKLGAAPEECAFVGDSEVDIRTAKNAGMPAIGCAWGYRTAEDLEREGADVLLSAPIQLKNLFE